MELLFSKGMYLHLLLITDEQNKIFSIKKKQAMIRVFAKVFN